MRNIFRLSAAVLTLTALLAWTVVTPVTALAASPTPSRPAPSGTTQPFCGPSSSVSPANQGTGVGIEISITIYWDCQTTIDVGTDVDWGDGGHDSYECYVNCYSGSHTFTHRYYNTGGFTATFTGFGSGIIYNTAQVYVSS